MDGQKLEKSLRFVLTNFYVAEMKKKIWNWNSLETSSFVTMTDVFVPSESLSNNNNKRQAIKHVRFVVWMRCITWKLSSIFDCCHIIFIQSRLFSSFKYDIYKAVRRQRTTANFNMSNFRDVTMQNKDFTTLPKSQLVFLFCSSFKLAWQSNDIR